MLDKLKTVLTAVSQPNAYVNTLGALTTILGFVGSVATLYREFKGDKHVSRSESSLSDISDLLDIGQKLGLETGDVKAVQPSYDKLLNDKLLVISEDWFRSLLDNPDTNPDIKREKKNIGTGYNAVSLLSLLVLSLGLLAFPASLNFLPKAQEQNSAVRFTISIMVFIAALAVVRLLRAIVTSGLWKNNQDEITQYFITPRFLRLELVADADSVVRNAESVFHHVYTDSKVVCWNRLTYGLYAVSVVSLAVGCTLVAPRIDLDEFFVWTVFVSFVISLLAMVACYISSVVVTCYVGKLINEKKEEFQGRRGGSQTTGDGGENRRGGRRKILSCKLCLRRADEKRSEQDS